MDNRSSSSDGRTGVTAATAATDGVASTGHRSDRQEEQWGQQEQWPQRATGATAATGNSSDGGDGSGCGNRSCTATATRPEMVEMLCGTKKKIIISVNVVLYDSLPQYPHMDSTDWHVDIFYPHRLSLHFSVKALIIIFIRHNKSNQLLCTFLCTN